MKNLRILLIVGLILGVGFLLWPRPALTPEERLEQHGFCDIVYYEPAETWKSHFLGATPIIGIGVIWHRDAPKMALANASPALVKWFGEVIEIAVSEDTEWRLMEIDVLYEGGSGLELAKTIVIARARRLEDGETKRYLDDIVVEGGLTAEEFQTMIGCRQIQVVPNDWGWEYTRGFNCDSTTVCE
jgi:hypothetical protein